jgi:hypothetical protein
MPVSLDLGTIAIADQHTAPFVQGQSMDDLKKIVTDFLTQQAHRLQRKPAKKQGKWAKVADEFKGTLSADTFEHLREHAQEIRNGFELRNLK